MTERAVTFSMFDLNVKSILRESERKTDREVRKVHNYATNLKNKFEFEKSQEKNLNRFSKANYLFLYNDKFTYVISIIRFHWRFQRKTSIVSSFRLFTTIMTNQKHQINWKNLRNLSKLSCEMNYSYFIFKSSRNHSKTMISIVLISLQNIKNKNINTFSRIYRTMILTRISQNILVRKSYDDSNKNLFDDLNFVYNAIQNQKDDRKFTLNKINRKSIKIYCIVNDSIAWIVNATNKIVFEIHEIILFKQEKCEFCKSWFYKRYNK